MRFLLSLALTLALAFVAGIFLPWWSIALVAFLVALLLPQRSGAAFGAGFLAIFLLWAGIAAWIDWKNQQVLSKKIALVFPLGGSPVAIILVTALIGALVAGFAALAGSSLRPAPRLRKY